MVRRTSMRSLALLALATLAALTSAQRTTAPVKPAATARPAATAKPVARTTVKPTAAPITEAPTAAPTAAPTSAPVGHGGRDYIGYNLSPDKRCIQDYQPPGVKPGSCLENVCYPKGVAINGAFNTTVRWCLQRPRRYNLVMDVLDRNTKEFYFGMGYTSNGSQQCGQHTFEVKDFKVKKTNDTVGYDIMWKFFNLPIWGPPNAGFPDMFPNMLAECGIPVQPAYTGLVDNCPKVPTTEFILPDTGKQDAINWAVKVPCLTPGKAWAFKVDTHIESIPKADLRCNMQIGTGGDKYLGPNDIYVDESDIFGLTANTKAKYWTTNNIPWTAAQTKKVKPNDLIYLACFMTPPNAKLGKMGYDFIERDFYLEIEFCPAA